MGYRIDSHHGGGGPREEIAGFLARFVGEGNLAAPKPGDDDPAKWLQRFGWWWSHNPACGAGDLTALVLRAECGGIVGFLGFIPWAYERDGEAVPSAVSTTFFVSPDHREASMGLVARLRALARTCQVVDGSPSPEMARILERLCYEHAGDRRQYLLPARLPGRRLFGGLLELASLGLAPRSDPALEGARLIDHPGEIALIPPSIDGALRRAVRPEWLAWLLESGSEPRRFAGLIDREGELLAYGLLLERRRCGTAWAVLADYADFTPVRTGLATLLSRICERPGFCGLDSRTRFIAWSVFSDEELPGLRGLKRRSFLYYQRPAAWRECPRERRPIEGDLALL